MSTCALDLAGWLGGLSLRPSLLHSTLHRGLERSLQTGERDAQLVSDKSF